MAPGLKCIRWFLDLSAFLSGALSGFHPVNDFVSVVKLPFPVSLAIETSDPPLRYVVCQKFESPVHVQPLGAAAAREAFFGFSRLES